MVESKEGMEGDRLSEDWESPSICIVNSFNVLLLSLLEHIAQNYPCILSEIKNYYY